MTTGGARSSRSLIVNGQDAERGRYPYFVSLERYGAGVLIAPRVVLTAGHCVPADDEDVAPHVGAYSYSDFDEAIAIEETQRHPQYQSIGFDEHRHDVALLKLQRAVSTTRFAQINRDASLPRPLEDNLTVIGLGSLRAWTDERPEVLQQTTIQAVTNSDCQAASNGGESFRNRIVPSHLCTVSDSNNERDSCDYDSGGPILLLPREEDGDGGGDVVVGLVSWGIGCANPYFPAVNTRVSDASDWIDQVTCRWAREDGGDPTEFGCEMRGKARTRRRSVGNHAVALTVVAALAFLLYRRWKRSEQYLFAMEDDVERKSLRESSSHSSGAYSEDSTPDYRSTEITSRS